LPYINFFCAIHPPLLVYFNCRFWTDLEAVSTARAFADVGYLCGVIAIGIDPVWGEYENIYRADIVTA
jgi:hypothetical protein